MARASGGLTWLAKFQRLKPAGQQLEARDSEAGASDGSYQRDEDAIALQSPDLSANARSVQEKLENGRTTARLRICWEPIRDRTG